MSADENVTSNGTPNDDYKRIMCSRVVIMRDGLSESTTNSIISLMHPGYARRTMFYLVKNPAKIYEIQKVDEEQRCWLVNQILRTDKQMYLITPIDPLFILLPYLKEHCLTRAVPLEHILASSGDPKLIEIRDTIKRVDLIADLKGPEALCAYKYNEEKTMKWLEIKVQRVVQVLKKKTIYVKGGAASSSFVPSSREKIDADEDSYLKYAFGIVSEYLNEELIEALYSHLKLNSPCNSKRKSLLEEQPLNKRIKTEDMDSFQEAHSNIIPTTEAPKPAKVETPKEKLNRRAAAGSKNIMSFFESK